MLNSEKVIRISAVHCRDKPQVFHSLLLYILIINEIAEFRGFGCECPIYCVSILCPMSWVQSQRGEEQRELKLNIIHQFILFLLFFLNVKEINISLFQPFYK